MTLTLDYPRLRHGSTGLRVRVVLVLRRLPLAVLSSKLALRVWLLCGKRSCGFVDSPTSGSDGRTTCTRGAALGVWPCVGSHSGAL